MWSKKMTCALAGVLVGGGAFAAEEANDGDRIEEGQAGERVFHGPTASSPWGILGKRAV